MTTSPASAPIPLDAGDLGALDAHARHQALLAEDESISIILKRGGGEVLGHTVVDDDDSRTHADLPNPWTRADT